MGAVGVLSWPPQPAGWHSPRWAASSSACGEPSGARHLGPHSRPVTRLRQFMEMWAPQSPLHDESVREEGGGVLPPPSTCPNPP